MPEMKFKIPRSFLSGNKMMRRQFLDEYFPSGLIPFEQNIGNEWEITAFVPRDPNYYVDPNLEKVLEKWQHPVSIETIGNYRSFYKNTMISFYDSWSIYYWSLLFSFFQKNNSQHEHLTLFHIDDHKDLGSPLLVKNDGEYTSLFTRENVKISDPVSIKEAVISKSIGIDSFIVPLVISINSLDILHLRYAYRDQPIHSGFTVSMKNDLLLSTEKERAIVKFNNVNENYSYSIDANLSTLRRKIKTSSIVLLHVDCDAFCNRYNLNTNWSPTTVSIDSGLREIKEKINQLMESLSQLPNRFFLNIALSPGFFPSEYWEEICNHFIVTAQECGIIKDDDFSKFLEKQYPEELRYKTTASYSTAQVKV